MNKKKLLALLMALVMTLSLMPMTVIAEELETVTPIAEPAEAVAVESVSFEAMNSVASTSIDVDGTATTVYPVSEGFYQDGETHTKSTNFYITSKEGLEYFRDLVNAKKTVADSYVRTWAGYSESQYVGGFYSNNIFSGKTVHLLSDIDLANNPWMTIGYNHVNGTETDYYDSTIANTNNHAVKSAFYGNFNGHNHTISNLNVSYNSHNCLIKNSVEYGEYGLFGYIAGLQTGPLTISNLTIHNATVDLQGKTGSYDYIGAFVGNAGSNTVTFDNCHLAGKIAISSTYYAGGFTGMGNANFKDCSVVGENGSQICSPDYYAGGLTGSIRSAGIQMPTSCSVSGIEIVANYAGGLIGQNNSAATSTFGTCSVTDSTIDGTINADVEYGWPIKGENESTTLSFSNVTIVKPAPAVAQIGDNGQQFETLEEAFANAVDGDTINVLADCNGDGIKVPEGKFNNQGLTVDFGGHTYTVDGETVGSTGTETNGFQLLKNNKITFQNGAITSEKAKILVQNYSNLTLDGMTLTLNNPNYTGAYTLSNNNGNVVIKDTTINANTAGRFAFDVCRYASYPSVSVEVKGNSVINGDIEVDAGSGNAMNGMHLTLTSGTHTGEIKLTNGGKTALDAGVNASITKASTFTQPAPEGYTWSAADANGVQTLEKLPPVAQIGTTKYATLQEAIAAIPAGETATIELLQNTSFDGIIYQSGSPRTITVDLKEYTLTVDDVYVKSDYVTFANGTIAAEGDNTWFRVFGAGTNGDSLKTSLTIDPDVTCTASDSYGIIVQGPTYYSPSGYDAQVNIYGTLNGGGVFVSGNMLEGDNVVNVYGVINCDHDVGIALNGAATVNVYEGASVTATGTATGYAGKGTGVEVRAGTLNVTGGSIAGHGSPASVTANNSGTTSEGAGITVSTYDNSAISVNISGGTISGFSPLYLANTVNKTQKALTLSVSGGNFACTDGGEIAVAMNQDSPENRASSFITGGKFSSEPDKSYVADGYEAVSITNEAPYTHQVGKITTTPLTANEGATDASATYEAQKTVVDEAGNPLSDPETPITVTVTANQEEDGTKAIAKITNITDKALRDVVGNAADKAGDAHVETANVEITVAKKAVDTETDGKVTYEVHPEAIITPEGGTSTTVKLTNEQIAGTFTFKLNVSALNVSEGAQVTVVHKHANGTSENMGTFTVDSDKNITLTVSSFSEFDISAATVDSSKTHFDFKGIGLRRRVRTNDGTTVVRSTTDIRFGYELKDYSASNTYYFQWKKDGGEWSNPIEITNFNSNHTEAALVINKVPSSAFGTIIYTRIFMVDGNGNTHVLDGEGKSVDGAIAAITDPANDFAEKWVNYAKFLKGDISQYSISDY